MNNSSLHTAIESHDADLIINILSQLKAEDRIKIGERYEKEFAELGNADDVTWLLVKNLITPLHKIRAKELFNASNEATVAEILAPLDGQAI